MFGQLLPNKNEQVHVATVLPEISRRKLGDQLNVALLYEVFLASFIYLFILHTRLA